MPSTEHVPLPPKRRSAKREPAAAIPIALTLSVSIFLTACSGRKQPPVLVDPGHDLVLRDVTVVDTHDGHLTPGSNVYIQAGRIVAIDQASSPRSAGSAPVVDGQGKFLVPGFVDAHVHVLGSPDATSDEALMLANGITSFRQMSGTPELLQQRQQNRLYQSTFTPKVLAMPGEVFITTNVFTPEQAVAEVDRQKSQGADFIKVGVTPAATFFAIGAEAKKVGLPFEGHLQPGVDAIDAAHAGYRSFEHLGPGDTILIDCSTEEASLKREIAAHPMKKPPPIPGFLAQMFLGKLLVDPLIAEVFLDHGTLPRFDRIIATFDEGKCRNMAAVMARSGSWQTPTLIRLRTSNFFDQPEYQHGSDLQYVAPKTRKLWSGVGGDFTEKFNPAQRATIAKWWQLQLKLARIFDDAGVPMMAGSDSASGTAPGFNLHGEFALLAQDGFTPLKILQMTTLNPARFYGREATMGRVQVGADADLVLLDGNPIASAKNLDGIQAVVRNGAFYPRDVLDTKLRDVARQQSLTN